MREIFYFAYCQETTFSTLLTILEDTDTPIASYLGCLDKNYLKDITNFFLQELSVQNYNPCHVYNSILQFFSFFHRIFTEDLSTSLFPHPLSSQKHLQSMTNPRFSNLRPNGRQWTLSSTTSHSRENFRRSWRRTNQSEGTKLSLP